MQIFHQLVGPDTAMKLIIKAFLKGVLYHNGCYEICNQYIAWSLARDHHKDETNFSNLALMVDPSHRLFSAKSIANCIGCYEICSQYNT